MQNMYLDIFHIYVKMFNNHICMVSYRWKYYYTIPAKKLEAACLVATFMFFSRHCNIE